MGFLLVFVLATEKTEGLLRPMTQDELWQTKYNEVVAFIETNKRNPSKYIPTERGTYLNWIKHNRKQYNAGEMKAERRERFEVLMALCETYRKKINTNNLFRFN